MNDRQYSFPVAATLKAGTRVKIQPDGRIDEANAPLFSIGKTIEDSRDGWAVVELAAVPFVAMVSEQMTAGTLVKRGGLTNGNVLVLFTNEIADIEGMNLRYVKPWSQTLILPYNAVTASVPASSATPATPTKAPSPRTASLANPISTNVTRNQLIQAGGEPLGENNNRQENKMSRTLSCKDEFQAAIAAKMQANPRMTRDRAASSVLHEDPDLRKRMLCEANPGKESSINAMVDEATKHGR